MKTKDSSGNFHNSSILGKHSSKKLSFYVLAFFLLFNFVSTGGHFDSHDGMLYYLVTESMVINQSIKIDPTSPSVDKLEFEPIIETFVKFWVPEVRDDYSKGIKTPFYMPGGIFGPALAIPWYMLSSFLGIEPINFVAFFTNSVILSLTSFILFLIGREYFSSYKIGFIIALVFSLTSFIWPYNTTFFLQPAQALVLVSSFYFLILSKKNESSFHSTIAGFFLGLAVLIHPSSIIFLPGFVIYGVAKLGVDRKLIPFFLTVAILSLLQLIVNQIKYDSWSNFGYDAVSSAITHVDWIGLAGLVYSPGWGIIFYFPLSILLPLAFHRAYKNDKKFFFLSIYMFFSIWLFFGTEPNPHWSGFGSWGPRYFIPFLPFASILLGFLVLDFKKNPTQKISFVILAIIGFVVNLLGKLVWYMTGYGFGWGVDKLIEKANAFDFFAWDPYYSPIIEHIKVLLSDYGGLTMNPITRTIGCSVDIFLFCTTGIIPILILLILIVISAFYISKNLGIKAFKISGFSNNN